jgi:hypothetical protein
VREQSPAERSWPFLSPRSLRVAVQASACSDLCSACHGTDPRWAISVDRLHLLKASSLARPTALEAVSSLVRRLRAVKSDTIRDRFASLRPEGPLRSATT